MKPLCSCRRVDVFLVVFLAFALPTLRPAMADEAAEMSARSILRESGLTGGLVVRLGCGDRDVLAGLRASEHHLVHGLDRDPATVSAARKHLRSRGLLGSVSADVLTGDRLPYADNVVNLLIAEDLAGVSIEEVKRVLVPDGTAYLRQGIEWKKTVKPRPSDIDEWTHWLYDPTGNAVAKDRRVGPPRQFQWSAGPLWSRHHNTVPGVSAMVSSGGRVFTIVDEAPPAMAGTTPDKWFLTARDAHNGIELWRRPMGLWGWRAWSTIWHERFNQPNNIPKRLVAIGDRVYVTLGFNSVLTALDAATGEVVKEYEGTQYTDEILYKDGLLILSINKQPQGPGEVAEKQPVRKSVAVLDAETGKQLWRSGDFVGNSTKTGPLERVTHLLLAAVDDRVVLLDGDAVVCLDLKTGHRLWRSARPASNDYTSRYHHRMSEMCTLVATDRVVLLCQLEPIQKRIGWRVIKARLQAYDTDSGEPLWQYACGNWGHFCVPDVFVAKGLVWVHDKASMSIVGLEPGTGIERQRLSTEKALDNGHHHRCYRNKATEDYLVMSYRGLEFVDWTGGEIDRNHWVRGTCRYGVMPCNGLIYSTPHPCDCYISSKLNGFLALAPDGGKAESGKRKAEGKRLEEGPAYDQEVRLSAFQPPLSDTWPTYRHDSARTGCGDGPAPSDLEVAWRTNLPGGRITAPVVAAGRVLVASVDTQTVHAIDAERGEPLWSYTAAGSVDTPPTLDRGRVLFGCRRGWVYCLRASDGELTWRFHAAPRRRLVVAHGTLESTWPVHGGVLVHDGKAYVTAGRSSFLDDGLAAYCLDVESGKVLDRQRITHEQDMNVDMGRNQNDDTGVVSDLLVRQGEDVYLRHLRLFGSESSPKQSGIGWGRRVGATAGMLDDSWFNRTVWMVDGQDHGELLVHDDERVYGVRVHKSRGHGDYIVPGSGAYRVTATERTMPVPRKPGGADAAPLSVKLWPRPKAVRWSESLPARITAMAIGGEILLCAGTPDRVDQQEPWAAYEGKRGGTVFAMRTDDGRLVSRLQLDAAPVYDGMAVVAGRLYLSTVDGTLLCIGDRDASISR